MPNVLVLFYRSYGHIELMAGAQAEGAARIPNVRVLVKRVPETAPPEIAKTSGFKLDQTGGAKPHCNGLLLAGAGGAGLHHQAGADAASRPLRGAGD